MTSATLHKQSGEKGGLGQPQAPQSPLSQGSKGTVPSRSPQTRELPLRVMPQEADPRLCSLVSERWEVTKGALMLPGCGLHPCRSGCQPFQDLRWTLEVKTSFQERKGRRSSARRSRLRSGGQMLKRGREMRSPEHSCSGEPGSGHWDPRQQPAFLSAPTTPSPGHAAWRWQGWDSKATKSEPVCLQTWTLGPGGTETGSSVPGQQATAASARLFPLNSAFAPEKELKSLFLLRWK